MKKNTTAITPEEFNRKWTILYRKYQIARDKARAEPNSANLNAFYQARKTVEDFVLARPPIC